MKNKIISKTKVLVPSKGGSSSYNTFFTAF